TDSFTHALARGGLISDIYCPSAQVVLRNIIKKHKTTFIRTNQIRPTCQCGLLSKELITLRTARNLFT
ncbi:hypothetical protein L9F63_006796, partial [Diploptera punctata]